MEYIGYSIPSWVANCSPWGGRDQGAQLVSSLFSLLIPHTTAWVRNYYLYKSYGSSLFIDTGTNYLKKLLSTE